MSNLGPQFQEQQLFDPGPAREQHPGDLSYEEWSERPDIIHHSTFTRDWTPDDSSVSHYGTRAAAEDNANRSWNDLSIVSSGGIPHGRPGGVDPHAVGDDIDVAEDMGGEFALYEDDVAATTGPGQIHSRRIESSGIAASLTPKRFGTHAADMRMTDAAANMADNANAFTSGSRQFDEDLFTPDGQASQYERDTGVSMFDAVRYAEDGDVEPIRSARQGASVMRGIDNIMDHDVPLAYENEVEDQGSTSYVAPRGSVRSWEEDVAASPNVSEEMKGLVAAHADKNGPRTTPFDNRTTRKSMGQSPATWGQREHVQDSFWPETYRNDIVKSFPSELDNPVHTVRAAREAKDEQG